MPVPSWIKYRGIKTFQGNNLWLGNTCSPMSILSKLGWMVPRTFPERNNPEHENP